MLAVQKHVRTFSTLPEKEILFFEGGGSKRVVVCVCVWGGGGHNGVGEG